MSNDDWAARCRICGEPMPKGEEMFNYHGFSGPCPKPPIPDDSCVSVGGMAADLGMLHAEQPALSAEGRSSDDAFEACVKDVLGYSDVGTAEHALVYDARRARASEDSQAATISELRDIVVVLKKDVLAKEASESALRAKVEELEEELRSQTFMRGVAEVGMSYGHERIDSFESENAAVLARAEAAELAEKAFEQSLTEHVQMLGEAEARIEELSNEVVEKQGWACKYALERDTLKQRIAAIPRKDGGDTSISKAIAGIWNESGDQFRAILEEKK